MNPVPKGPIGRKAAIKTKKLPKKLNVTQRLLLVVGQRGEAGSSELAAVFGLSRQMIARYLSKLVDEGRLVKRGSTRNAKYLIPTNEPLSDIVEVRSTKKLLGLDEDFVFSELSLRANLPKVCSAKTLLILKYTFTEMLNNAIDHSESVAVDISIEVRRKDVVFEIRDHGIGVFERVKKFFGLDNHFQAAEHLLKGKQTTDAAQHSGQGIFFTSRTADVFQLRSARLELTIDNHKADYFLKDQSALRGTLVRFQISRQTRKVLREIFGKFSNADLEFDRNSVRVKVSTRETLVSRSEAKRMLVGLERYARIEFDFNGVETIGQGFADEIFRVFQSRHPEIVMTYTHASSSVAFMIERSRRESL